MWSHLERQRSGGSFTGGPGETQKELDKRLIDDRIVRLKKEIADVSRTRHIHRSSRKKVPYPVVAMVGYTNAGKSSLFNNLTNAGVFVKDLLFATLDPTMRQLELPSNKKIILSDTVGFIADLPHQLVAAFKATLEEVLSADILLHVQDINHPKQEMQRSEVLKVLAELGIDNETYLRKTIEVYNKADLLKPHQLKEAKKQEIYNGAVLTSALDNSGIKDLINRIETQVLQKEQSFTVDIPFEDGYALSWVYGHTSVLKLKEGKTSTKIGLKADEKQAHALINQFKKYIKKN